MVTTCRPLFPVPFEIANGGIVLCLEVAAGWVRRSDLGLEGA